MECICRFKLYIFGYAYPKDGCTWNGARINYVNVYLNHVTEYIDHLLLSDDDAYLVISRVGQKGLTVQWGRCINLKNVEGISRLQGEKFN